MGISIGEIDIANEIIELHFQLRRTQKILEIVLAKLPDTREKLTPNDLNEAENDALRYVQEKFPSMGIQRKG